VSWSVVERSLIFFSLDFFLNPFYGSYTAQLCPPFSYFPPKPDPRSYLRLPPAFDARRFSFFPIFFLEFFLFLAMLVLSPTPFYSDSFPLFSSPRRNSVAYQQLVWLFFLRIPDMAFVFRSGRRRRRGCSSSPFAPPFHVKKAERTRVSVFAGVITPIFPSRHVLNCSLLIYTTSNSSCHLFYVPVTLLFPPPTPMTISAAILCVCTNSLWPHKSR